MSNTIGAIAPVRWLDEQGGEETVLFIIADTPEELEEADQAIYERFRESGDLDNITVVEVTHSDWNIARHGQNINKGWHITNTQDIERIQR